MIGYKKIFWGVVMALGNAHEGYEYQDLFSSYFIISQLIKGEYATFNIDLKEYSEDKFDDLTIQIGDKLKKYQIKYSNSDINLKFEKKHLANGGGYDLAIDNLFKSWEKNILKDNTTLRLELAWEEHNDELKEVLVEVDDSFHRSFKHTKLFKVDVDKLWPQNGGPRIGWNRLKKNSPNIDRSDFKKFCDNLLIEINLPKANLDLENPGELEKILILKAEKLGIGKYPNNHLKVIEAILKIIHEVKKSRAKGVSITTDYILNNCLKLKLDYGSINQKFEIDNKINILNEDLYLKWIEEIKKYNKFVIFGEPGAGKSWFIQNLILKLNEKKIPIIKHYCYTGIDDENSLDRIKVDVFYGNLIADILKKYPDLKKVKPTLFGSSFDELQILLKEVTEDVVLIIDGLDHIDRTFKLNENNISKKETNIVKKILELNIPERIKIIIATQPLMKEKFEEKKYKIEKLPLCDNLFIKRLIEKYDMEVSNEKIETILEKSNGNALYISYIINEMKNNLDENFLSKLPNYNHNLKSYYEYLMTKLNERDNIVYALCGVSFPLLRKELEEITGEGDLVDEGLNILSPILKENYSTGGLIIYHESFRRYILDLLNTSKVNINKKIFCPIIEWFQEKDFFSYFKSHKYFFSVLYESGKYETILSYLDKNFVVNSLKYGHPRTILDRNYNFLLKAAIKLQNFESIIVLSELKRVLIDTRDEFSENIFLYIEALGEVSGYKYLKELSYFENMPLFDKKLGLEICYLCSRNNIIPEWDIYLSLESDIKDKEREYKYFIRQLLDFNKKEEILAEIHLRILNENSLEFNILKEEVMFSYGENEWEIIYDEIKRLLDVRKDRDKKYIEYEKINEEILSMEHFSVDGKSILVELIKQIDYFLAKDSYIINEFIDKLSNRSWFYNWIIYLIKIKEMKRTEEKEDENILKIYEILLKDLDPFKGNVRACDLFSIELDIYKTLSVPLRWIKSNETLEKVLNVLYELSRGISTSVQGTQNGPLSSNNFIKILKENVTKKNVDIVIKIAEKSIKGFEEQQLFYYTTKNKYYLSIIYSKSKNKEKAKKIFIEALNFSTAYTFRKDQTLNEVLNTITNINRIDKKIGHEYIKKILVLVKSVSSHTDGKGTKHYLIEWFAEFSKIEPQLSALYLLNEGISYRYYWKIEKSLIYLLIELEDKVDPLILNFLLKMYPVNTDKHFLELYCRNITKISNRNIKKLSFYDLLNRITYNEDVEKIDKDVINQLKEIGNIIDEDINYLFRCEDKEEKILDKEKSRKVVSTIEQLLEMDLLELYKYYSNKKVLKNEIGFLIKYFNNLDFFTEECRIFIDNLTVNDFREGRDREHLENLKEIFDLIELEDMYIYAHIKLFIRKTGDWYQQLSDPDCFEKAYLKNKDKAIKVFFESISELLESKYSPYELSSNMINALIKVNYDKKEIMRMWKKLFQIISERLPIQKKIDWDETLNNQFKMSIEEILICILLSKMKIGEVERQKWVLNFLVEMAKSNLEILKKPIKWLLKNQEKFLEVSIILILQLFYDYKEIFNDKFILSISEEIKQLHRNDSFMINYLIEELLNPSKGKKQNHNKMILVKNNKYEFLKKNKFDVEKTFKEIREEVFLDKTIGKLFINRISNRMLPNLYISNIIQKKINSLFVNVKEDKNDIFESLKYDLINLLKQQKALIIRPKDLRFPSELSNNKEKINTENKKWIRLAYFEKEFCDDGYHKNKLQFKEKVVIQYLQMPEGALGLNYNLTLDFLEETLMIFLEDKILKYLNLVEKKSIEKKEYYDYSLNKVLIYNRWNTGYSRFPDHLSDEITKLNGGEILIEEKLLKEFQWFGIFGNKLITEVVNI